MLSTPPQLSFEQVITKKENEKPSMRGRRSPEEFQSRYPCYEIRLRGHLDARWAKSFEGMTIRLEGESDTVLIGQVVDQAALHGLLKIVRDLGISLVSVRLLETSLTGSVDTQSN